MAWANLTNDDLIYAPRNPWPNRNYGLDPVEQIIVTINTAMRGQAAQLAYFTEGDIPSGHAEWPRRLESGTDSRDAVWLDVKLSGHTAQQAKLLWAPAATRYQAFKDAPIKDDFDEWLARIVACAFNLPPTPFIGQMNKGLPARIRTAVWRRLRRSNLGSSA